MEDLNHFVHSVLGFGAAAAALVALATSKGSTWHRRAGWVFVGGMAVAAITAWLFMIARPLPLAMVSATVTIYALSMALFAINPQLRAARRWEWLMFTVLVAVMLGMLAVSANLYRAGSGLFMAPLAMFAIFAIFVSLDWRYLRAETTSRIQRLRRHALFMALAVSQMIMAPTIIVAPDVGLPVPVIVFGSLLFVPLIFFCFAPAARRAAARDHATGTA
ncbi:hypothetical protein [Qipengyuania sp. RANM35]|uniref:hypothetical protein n=1 Tax=Qipengyuania sp. RANM35 TaxID=3068635 RepID=UPI0034DB4682